MEIRVAGYSKNIYTDALETDRYGGDQVSVGQCGTCNSVLVGRQRLLDYEKSPFGDDDGMETWSAAQRIWPEPATPISASIPKEIRNSLLDAEACLRHGIYTPSVAMSGRALEAIGRHFHTGPNPERLMLFAAINELKKTGTIDERLYLWSKELHENRNLAAHATGVSFTRVDAQDLFDFALAICEYVFVVQEKYDEFMARKQSRKTAPAQDAQI